MRGIAVLGVVAFHAGLPLPGGFTGVDIFFVISGYVITGQLLREIDSSGSIRLRRFFTGRFRRLGPALGVMVAVTLVISFFTLSPLGALQNTVLTGIGSVIGLANLVIDQTSGNYFDTAAENNALLNAWSLSVEGQFYLLFPVILVVSLMVFRILDCRNRNLFLHALFLWVPCCRSGLLRLEPRVSLEDRNPSLWASTVLLVAHGSFPLAPYSR